MNINWTNDLIFQLVDLYRERRLLWDHDVPENKDKVKKHRAWQDIADVMNLNKDIVMRKMKILTTQFQREYAKCRQLPADEGSKWFAYCRLLFLAPNQTSRPAAALAPAPAPAPAPGTAPAALNTYEHYRVSPLDEYTIEVKEEVDMSEGESFPSSASGGGGGGGGGGARRRKLAPASPAPAPAPAPARDEYSLYGEYVAVKLRRLTDAYTRHKAQQQINDILFRAEMEDLSHQ